MKNIDESKSNLLGNLHLHFALTYYNKFRKELIKIENEIGLINDQKTRVQGGIIFKNNRSNTSNNDRLLNLLEIEDGLRLEYNLLMYYIKIVDDFLSNQNDFDRRVLIGRFIEKLSWYEMENRFNFSKRQLYRIISKIIRNQ